jgi:hypothetical protein
VLPEAKAEGPPKEKKKKKKYKAVPVLNQAMIKYERVKDFHTVLLNGLGQLHAETKDTRQCPREGPDMVKNHTS